MCGGKASKKGEGDQFRQTVGIACTICSLAMLLAISVSTNQLKKLSRNNFELCVFV